MRAVMSAVVSFKPSDGPERHATRSEVRKGLAQAGLTPPPLVRYRDRISETEPDGWERDLFAELARVVGAASKEREHISPDDLLVLDDSKIDLRDFSDAAGVYIDDGTEAIKATALKGLAGYALPVLTRMPARSGEDRDKRRSAAQSLLFASTVTPTRSLFIVSSENERSVTFRLHHQLIERLQKGCEDLVVLLHDPIPSDGGQLTIRFDGAIEIYEVGQEDSTIKGSIVGNSFRERAQDAVRAERVQYTAFFVLFMLFLVLLALLAVEHLSNGTVADAIIVRHGKSFVYRDDGFWLGEAQRLQSGVIPVLLVTVVTLVLRFPRGLIIRWTQRYTKPHS
jgi:hypothetical protein